MTCVVAFSAACTTAVDTEPRLQGATTGMFLTITSLDGAVVTGTVTATRLDENNAGAGYTATVDTSGRVFLPMEPGEWAVTIRDDTGTVLDCDPLDTTMSAEVGVRSEAIVCNLPPQQ
jgi:hypothetical protein